MADLYALYYIVFICRTFVVGDNDINYPNRYTEEDIITIDMLYSTYCEYEQNCEEFGYTYKGYGWNESIYTCCHRCSCDLSSCSMQLEYSNCCPVTLNEQDNRFMMQSCIQPVFQTWTDLKDNAIPNSYLMVDRCTRNSDIPDNTEYVDKCERSTSYTSFDTKIPVSLSKGNYSITYKNIYCAYCNRINEVDLIGWYTQVECIGVYIDITLTSFERVVELIRENEFCSLKFVPPSEIELNGLTSCENQITQCNITGQWRHYDPIIEAVCRSYYSPFLHEYKNIFCFLCNVDLNNTAIPECEISKRSSLNSFSLILKFMPMETQQVQTLQEFECGISSIYDPFQRKCLTVKCLLFQVYVAGRCQTNLETFSDSQFSAIFRLTPREAVTDIDELATEIETYMWGALEAHYLSHFVKTFQMYKPKKFGVHSTNDYYATYFEISYTSSNSMLNISGIKWILNQHGTNLTIFDKYNESNTLYVELDTRDALGNVKKYVGQFTTLLPVFLCPVVEIDLSVYNVIYSSAGVTIQELGAVLNRNEYMFIDDSTMLICRGTFEYHVEVYKRNNTLDVSRRISTTFNSKPQAILSLVCSCCSIFCSAVSILVYIRVRNMRSQPGINNVCLLLSLMGAQVFFQFGIGQSKHIPGWVCGLIGGFGHYLWLVTILWMNVCTFHMFRQFRSLRILTHTRQIRRTTGQYWFYCLSVGLVPVLINIVTSYVKRRGYGYGGTLCYISDYIMVGICFAVPVAIVLCANFALFFATVYYITQRPIVNSDRKEEKHFLLVYAKLSTVTGLTWTFGFLYTFSNFYVFEYLFIIFNAGQGVFLFLSFVCNKRVLNCFKRPEIQSF